MNVREWLDKTKMPERLAVAQDRRVKTTIDYMYQLAGNHRRPSPRLALALEDASKEHTPDFVMTAAALRPDIFGRDRAA